MKEKEKKRLFFCSKMPKNTKNAFFLHFSSKKFAYMHFL